MLATIPPDIGIGKRSWVGPIGFGGIVSMRSLGGALLAAMAVRVTTGTALRPGQKGAAVRDQTNSAFAAAAQLLDEFGVLQTDKAGNRCLTVDAGALLKSWDIRPKDARYERLLVGFLAMACHYDGLAAGHSWFRAPVQYDDIMAAFAQAGFAQRQSDLYRWTTSIAPHMAAAGLWNSRIAEAEERQKDRGRAEAQRAWETMPVFVRRRFFGGDEVDMLSFVSVVAHCWDGAQWRPFTKARRFLDIPDARQLAERMIDHSARARRGEREPN